MGRIKDMKINHDDIHGFYEEMGWIYDRGLNVRELYETLVDALLDMKREIANGRQGITYSKVMVSHAIDLTKDLAADLEVKL